VIFPIPSKQFTRPNHRRVDMILNGNSTLVLTGSPMNNTFKSPFVILTSLIHMNSLESENVLPLLHLPIDAILLYHRLSVCAMVVLPLVLLELVKPKPQRILELDSVFGSSSSTALVNSITRVWQRSSRDSVSLESGDASMSSIVFPYPLCLSSPLKLIALLKQRRLKQRSSNSQVVK
jgi:hypothetical protein